MIIKELKKDIRVKKLNFSDVFEIEINDSGRRIEYKTCQYIPNSTGIYIFFNDLMEVMYVGKSTELKARLRCHLSDCNSKVYTALNSNKCNIKYYMYALCDNNRDAELYEMIYTSIYKPKMVDLTREEIRSKKII